LVAQPCERVKLHGPYSWRRLTLARSQQPGGTPLASPVHPPSLPLPAHSHLPWFAGSTAPLPPLDSHAPWSLGSVWVPRSPGSKNNPQSPSLQLPRLIAFPFLPNLSTLLEISTSGKHLSWTCICSHALLSCSLAEEALGSSTSSAESSPRCRTRRGARLPRRHAGLQQAAGVGFVLPWSRSTAFWPCSNR